MNKVLIAVLVVLGIVIVGGAVITFSAVDHAVNDTKGECKYTATVVDSYTYDGILGPTVDHPGDGKKFVRVTGTLTNEQDTYTVSNNPYNFKLNASGLLYTYDHKNYETVDIANGGTASFDLCFEVPDTASDFELQWEGLAKIKMTKQ